MDVKNYEEMWKSIYSTADIEEDHKYSFNLIIKSSELVKIDEKEKIFIVVAKTNLDELILNNNFYQPLAKSISKYTDNNYKLTIITKEKFNKNLANKKEIEYDLMPISDSLNKKFNFDNFIVSEKNLLLYKAAIAIALANDSTYLNWNPFFIYGKSGLGKTHILHSIGNEIKKNFPKKSIKYIEAKDFGDIVIRALDSKNVNQNIQSIFKEYENYDCLLIDDIQFIQTRKKTKEIFFNIFNFFINNNKQIVVTSDQDPKELTDFEERFITRFKGGLTIKVFPPDLKTSEEILKLKIKNNNKLNLSKFSKEAIEWMANNFGENIRFLEGALNRLLLFVINSEDEEKQKIGIDFIEEVFQDVNINERISFNSIINKVTKKYGISQNDILSKSRKKEIVIARNISIFLSREILNYSLKEIGKKFNKDHTTIMYSIQKMKKEIDNNSEFKEVINEFMTNV